MHDPKQILKKWAEDNQLIQSLCVIDGFDRVQIEESRAIEVVLQLVEPNRRPGITSKHFKEFDSHKQAWTDELVYHTGLSNIILHPSGHPLGFSMAGTIQLWRGSPSGYAPPFYADSQTIAQLGIQNRKMDRNQREAIALMAVGAVYQMISIIFS